MNRNTIPAFVALILLSHAASAAAQAPAGGGGADSDDSGRAAYAMSALRLAEAAPTIDGRLDEPFWQSADVATGFTQIQPDLGSPATLRTEVRIAFDGEAVYVGARMHDTAPDSIVARLARRDDDVFSDWFHVAFDSYYDKRTAFGFGVNPAGVKQDLFIYNDHQTDESWDAVWDAAATIDAQGWVAEFRIPLSQLRFDAGGAGTWGVNFKRLIARRNEDAFWAPIRNPNEPKLVSIFGRLEGMRGLESPRRLELQPYSVARLTRAPGDAANPFYEASELGGSAGFDLKYGLSSDLTLTATVNPDFGQVEADPSVVNLTAYESYFPEKRPFFQEGADIFNFSIGLGDGDLGNESLFYSRRIGRSPQAGLPGDAAYGDVPDATTILGAAKISGKTSNGWSVGVLDAVTAREEAPYVGELGERGSVVVEPLTNYGVARVIKDFRDGESAIGGILTSVHRSLEAEDRLDFLTSNAYAGGIDVRHRFAGGDYQVRGYLLGSMVSGGADAVERLQRAPGRYFQRPDADHVELDPARTSLTGGSGMIELSKIGGGNWHWGTVVQAISPGFEVNDIGFQTQRDLAVHAAFANYNQLKSGERFRQWNIGGSAWHGYTYGGERVALGGSANGWGQFKNFWSIHGGMNVEGWALSTDALRGGPALRRSPNLSMFAGFNSDNRQALRFGSMMSHNRNLEHDGRSFSLSPSLSWRASTQMDLSIRPSFRHAIDETQYVARRAFAGEDRYLFGRIEQTTLSFTTRMSYTFTPTLSLQLYAQPYVSAGEYTLFRQVADPKADVFGNRFATIAGDALAYDADANRYRVDFDHDGTYDASFGNPDFNFKQLRSTAVLRWEYLPGSTIFVVWSQGRTGFDRTDPRFDASRDFGRLFGLDDAYDIDGTNTLLVKVSYWFGR